MAYRECRIRGSLIPLRVICDKLSRGETLLPVNEKHNQERKEKKRKKERKKERKK